MICENFIQFFLSDPVEGLKKQHARRQKIHDRQSKNMAARHVPNVIYPQGKAARIGDPMHDHFLAFRRRNDDKCRGFGAISWTDYLVSCGIKSSADATAYIIRRRA